MEEAGGIIMVDNLARKLDNTPKADIEVSEAPVKWCSVSLSEMVERGKRLEASVFDVEAKHAWELIDNNKYGCIPLLGIDSPVKKAHYGGRLKRNYVPKTHEDAVGFIGSSEMLDIYPKPVKFMVDDQRVSDLHITENTVLLSRSGTIGNVAFVNETLSHFLVSEHAMRLECNDYSGYVYAFLKTKVGKKLVTSNIYGAVVDQIEPEHLASVPIPNAPYEIKKKIHELIIKSYELRDESNALIDEATKLLIEELHLPAIEDFDVSLYKKDASVDTFSVKLSEMNGRADASYHVPIVDEIVEHLKKYAAEVTTIGDERISSDVILPGRFKRVYVDEGYGRVFIGGKQLYELDPTNKKYLSLVHHADRIAKQLELHENMTLITCSGTVGKVTLVGKQWENWTANQHIIRVIPANNDVAGYISIFLSTDYGHELITRFTYGSVVDEIDDNHVKQIQIPILKNQGVQKKINNLALESNEKRYKAYLLEQEALKVLDEEVIYAE